MTNPPGHYYDHPNYPVIDATDSHRSYDAIPDNFVPRIVVRDNDDQQAIWDALYVAAAKYRSDAAAYTRLANMDFLTDDSRSHWAHMAHRALAAAEHCDNLRPYVVA